MENENIKGRIVEKIEIGDIVYFNPKTGEVKKASITKKGTLSDKIMPIVSGENRQVTVNKPVVFVDDVKEALKRYWGRTTADFIGSKEELQVREEEFGERLI